MADRPLTVLQVLPALESGGVERGTLEVAAALVHAGHRSIVISAGGSLVRELVASGSEHISLPVGRKSLLALLQVRRLRKILEQEHVDILHVRSRLPAWIAWLAWRGMPPQERPHFVTTVHGLYTVNRYSAIMTRGERVIAVSDTARQYILDNYSEVNPGRVVTIFRGVSPDDFPFGYRPEPDWLRSWYETYPVLKDGRVLTLPGRLTRLKGHEEFIRLIGELADKGIQVYGLIVGHLDPNRSKYIDELRQMIADRKLESRIIFTGQRSDIREIYACSDVVLSLSDKPESFGRTIVEALSLGVRAVGYGHGGVGESLARYYPFGCVPTGDLAQLTEKIIQILEGREPVSRTTIFTRQEMLDKTLHLYDELVTSN
jgi:glycosyltransferase involved in cell wall biosynthesis